MKPSWKLILSIVVSKTLIYRVRAQLHEISHLRVDEETRRSYAALEVDYGEEFEEPCSLACARNAA